MWCLSRILLHSRSLVDPLLIPIRLVAHLSCLMKHDYVRWVLIYSLEVFDSANTTANVATVQCDTSLRHVRILGRIQFENAQWVLRLMKRCVKRLVIKIHWFEVYLLSKDVGEGILIRCNLLRILSLLMVWVETSVQVHYFGLCRILLLNWILWLILFLSWWALLVKTALYWVSSGNWLLKYLSRLMNFWFRRSINACLTVRHFLSPTVLLRYIAIAFNLSSLLQRCFILLLNSFYRIVLGTLAHHNGMCVLGWEL